MNPGGDYGKKELSPALRNRFLEIWCPAENSREDLRDIVAKMMPPAATEAIVDVVVDFCLWFPAHKVSIRDIATWTAFVTSAVSANSALTLEDAVVQGACLVFFDGLKTATGNTIGLMSVAGEADLLVLCGVSWTRSRISEGSALPALFSNILFMAGTHVLDTFFFITLGWVP